MPISNDDVEFDGDGDDDWSEILVNIALFHRVILCCKKTNKTCPPPPFPFRQCPKKWPIFNMIPIPNIFLQISILGTEVGWTKCCAYTDGSPD